MIDRFEHFSYAVSEISSYWHKLTAGEMERYGLRGTHSIYLVTMDQYPQGITAPELCQLCHRDKADVSRMMSIMEKKGLVIKERVYESRYKGIFKLTAEGQEVAKHVRAKASYAVNYAGADLSDSDRKVLYESLDKILTKLEKLNEEGIPPYESLI